MSQVSLSYHPVNKAFRKLKETENLDGLKESVNNKNYQIKKIKADKKPEKKSYNHNKYFLNSSGYNLDKGYLQYSNCNYWINELNYGIKDYWSVGAGILPLNRFIDLPHSYYLKTKLSSKFYKDRTKVDLTFFYIDSKFYDKEIRDTSYFALSGAITFGNTETNISFGFIRFFFDYVPNTFYTINAKFKLSPDFSFITENNLKLDYGFETMSLIGFSYSFRQASFDVGTLLPFNHNKTKFNGFYPFIGCKISGSVFKKD